MKSPIKLILFILVIALLHVAMQPSQAKPTALQVQLKAMLNECKDKSECEAIANVIKRGVK